MRKKVSVLLATAVTFIIFTPQTEANFHNTFINIFEKAKDSVASITVTVYSPNLPKLDRFKGSGFVWTSDGYIISAAHLFQGNIKEIEVIVGFKTFKARIIGKDLRTDIALIKIDGAPPLKAFVLGDSDNVSIGEFIVSIGDPFGLDKTMTHGIISGKKRNLNSILDEFLQHDAAINPGNSGGPLINIRNEVIGMNTQIAEGNNTSFAVPINLIKIIAPMLKTSGKVARSWLGVEIAGYKEIDEKMLNDLKLPLSVISDEATVVILKVAPYSPADEAGIIKGDIVRFLNGKKIKTGLEFARLISYSPPGKTIYLVVERQNKFLTLLVRPVSYEEKN